MNPSQLPRNDKSPVTARSKDGVGQVIIDKKGFGIKNDYRVDSSQELVAIGMSNLMGSFVSSYTVTGKVSTQVVYNLHVNSPIK